MRYEIFNGTYVGTAEWMAPGEVALDVPDAEQRRWLEGYFAAEDSVMSPAGDHDGMTLERRDSSEAAFNRAMYDLAAYRYEVRPGEGRRHEPHHASTAS